jgi:hypothetical protein
MHKMPQHEASSVHTSASMPKPAHVRLQVKSPAGTPGDDDGAVQTSPRGQSSLLVHVIAPVSLLDPPSSLLPELEPPSSDEPALDSPLSSVVDGPLSLSVSMMHTSSTQMSPPVHMPASHGQLSLPAGQIRSPASDPDAPLVPVSPCESDVVDVSSLGQPISTTPSETKRRRDASMARA